MTKTLKYFIVLLVLVFSVSYSLGKGSAALVQAEDSQNYHDSENSDHDCPVIHWSWNNHEGEIAYEFDSGQCHWPSEDNLRRSYHDDNDFDGFRDDFREHNHEWRNRKPSPTPTPEVSPSAEPTPTSQTSNNDSGNGGSSYTPGPYTCNDADPGAPANLKAVALGGGKVKLTWDNAPGPHTTYAVAYGPSLGNYLYGDPNVGNVTTYTVMALNPGGKYCFYVQAQNGCRGGIPSNVVCTNQAGGVRVLGASSNYNPLIDGIKESYSGAVLGASTELMGTAEVVYSADKLPSGNTLIEGSSISIPAIGVNQALYRPQIIADQLAVGQHEVLNTTIDGSNVFYGHNGYDVFGSLYKVVKGDKVVVNGGNQKSVYTVTSTDFVQKSDVDSLKTNADQIVLVTCSFSKPDYRIVVKASLLQ
jgi:LPXTG-site transpeptidase (sortase) family protein